MLRRSFVAGLGGLWLPAAARAEPRIATNPFALGIASGCPRPGSVVLWTRLMAEGPRSERLVAHVPVGWAVAEDESMQRVVASGQAIAEARWAHSVHVDVQGLRPGAPWSLPPAERWSRALE